MGERELLLVLAVLVAVELMAPSSGDMMSGVSTTRLFDGDGGKPGSVSSRNKSAAGRIFFHFPSSKPFDVLLRSIRFSSSSSSVSSSLSVRTGGAGDSGGRLMSVLLSMSSTSEQPREG